MGAYAPMTTIGNIIVNGILVSCHSVVKSQSLVHTILQFLQKVEIRIKHLFNNINSKIDEVHIPNSIDFLYTIFYNFIPDYAYETH